MKRAKLSCGIGMARGRAVASALGAHDLTEIDLHGPVVNMAARLQGLPGIRRRVIVCGDLAAAMPRPTRPGPNGDSAARPRADEGMTRRLSAYELLPATAPEARETVLASWHEGVDWFTGGQWRAAYERLEDNFPNDPAAHCLMRIMERTGVTTPEDWDGSFAPPVPDLET